jgi:hypothetical protein
MKNRKITVLLILLASFSLQVGARENSRLSERSGFAKEKFQDSFQEALTSDNSEDDSGSLRAGGITPGKPTNPVGAPIGDALPFFLSLGLVYGASVLGSKKKQNT